jgi:hypothetical protein
MRLRRPTHLLSLVALVAFVALAAIAAGCGDDETTDVAEGEPLELGDLSFNVQITRGLNPNSPEDSVYLDGAPPLKPGEQYLGVFMEVSNDGDDVNVVPQPFRIVDTRGTIYNQAPVSNPFALEPGTPIEPGKDVPGVETAAANGPIKGSLILFILDQDASENRPLQLQVPGPDAVGTIELDL